MKKRIIIATFWLYSIAFAANAGDRTPDLNFIERKKTIVKVFDVRPDETLTIDNRYGNVKVQLWDKPSIRIEITIVANAPSEAKAEERINAMSIREQRSNNTIALQTVLASAAERNSWSGRKGENSIRIDYHVQMPKQNPLNVKNAFGNTDIARFQAPLAIETRHGTFRAEDLSNVASEIVIAYGSATIGTMNAGKLKASYSQVSLEKVKKLELSNRFGSLDIGEVESLVADINYAGTRIGTLTGHGNVKLAYSNGFSIGESTADAIDIQAAYSSIVLPVQKPAKFNVSVSYGNFQYPSNAPSHTNKSESGHTKRYEIMIGGGNPTSTIKVVSKYGNVKLKD